MRRVTVGSGDLIAGRWTVTTPLTMQVEGWPALNLDPGDQLEVLTLEADPGVPEAIWPAIRRGELELVEVSA